MTGHDVPFVDDHAHPFPLEFTPLDLGTLSLSAEPRDRGRQDRAAQPRLMIEVFCCRLAALLGCSPDEVRAARDDAAADWPSYVRRLFDDVGLTGMLLDGADDVEPYAAIAGTPMRPLLRLEPLIDSLLADGADGPAIVSAVSRFVTDGAAAGAAGFKTVLAYRTGLAVDPTVSAEQAYRAVLDDRDRPVRQRAKPLRDFLLRRVFALCADLGMPIQIHTGFGDSDIRLADANPVLLDDVLRTAEGAAARVVLIHAGYPWHEQLAYLTHVRSNVWAELSLVNLFSPVTTADRLLRLLDLAPADRLLFGTDGHGAPETHWFGATVLRSAWTEVAATLAPAVRETWLSDVEHRLFHQNAEELYPGLMSHPHRPRRHGHRGPDSSR